jgi:hypothetical protein
LAVIAAQPDLPSGLMSQLSFLFAFALSGWRRAALRGAELIVYRQRK